MKEAGKNGKPGKHWTKKEIEAREKAADLAKREKPKGIYPPASLSGEGKRVWERIMASMRGIELFDNVDTEMLESYCEIEARLRELQNNKMSLDQEKIYQGYLRLKKSYADCLGLSPASRAKMIKLRAEKASEDPFGKEFD
jgi:phage terminase small subunit